MAAGLADQILENFGIKAVLEEGHDGIYEVRLDQVAVYSNLKSCSGIKSSVKILYSIGQHVPVLQRKKLMIPL